MPTIVLYSRENKNIKCEPITDFSTLEPLYMQMLEAMVELRGIGIAAPQIGVNKTFVIVDFGTWQKVPMANPVIVEREGETYENEACLSLPGGAPQKVKRAHKIKVQFQDLAGNPQEYEAEGYLARVIQHELDHIAIPSLCYVDHLSPLKRDIVLRKMKKHLRGLETAPAQ